jgi:Na+-translocating ferredoxin:NAD+ oxidoreductase RnfD subunit
MTAVAIRGTTYPVVLPKLKDPRLHLAATIISLQVIGQIGFHFRLSIAQILISLATCAVIEMTIFFRQQRVIMWPASALLTGNGVAFILRVPGTQHGDWWSLRGWWVYVGTAAVALLSKYVIKVKGEHIFNPSNIGLVLCFLILGRRFAEPLDFWWGPMNLWLVLALAVILTGGFLILSRLKLLWLALTFWATFATGLAILALAGHTMYARWHLGPIEGLHFWWVLVTSPEVLVFLFFMITDPKTAPKSQSGRLYYAASLGLLGALLIAPWQTEYASKVALLCSLAVVCLAMPVIRLVPMRRPANLALAISAATAAVAYASFAIALSVPTRVPAEARALPAGALPPVQVLPSKGIQSELNQQTAQLVAHDLLAALHVQTSDPMKVHLEPGGGQNPPDAVAQLAGRTYRLTPVGLHWKLKGNVAPAVTPSLASGPVLKGFDLKNVAAQAGIDFRQASFTYGVVPSDEPAMMGGGLCWLDYNNDGWMDLFVVNSYADDKLPDYEAHGGLPTSHLYENEHGHFVDVSQKAHAAEAQRGEGCVAGDFDGDGNTDLFITTATDDELLWGNGNGTFTEGARKAGVVSFGWHAGAAIADVNGDGRPDLYVAGYSDKQHPIQGSTLGFPRNYPGVRDELFLNEGHRHFKEVAAKVGLDPAPFDHSLGAEFMDVNGDGRPDLFVANDEDPNRLYINKPGGSLGFHFADKAKAMGVADPNAGMGVGYDTDGHRLFVSNSRGQTHAVYVQNDPARFSDVRSDFKKAFGTNLTGWGDSWVDLRNDDTKQLVLANGAIPVTNLGKDAMPMQVLTNGIDGWVETGALRDVVTNGRGVAAADYDNDGRVDLAVNTVGGKLVLLHNTGPSGNWLEVNVQPFSPGAVVTIDTPQLEGGARQAVVTAGSSYLSSEDPRVHFGLGKATVDKITVRYPDGTVKTVPHPPTNAIVTVER